MVFIPSNFSAKQNVEICICGKVEDMKHLYICEYWNNGEISEKSLYEDIFSDNIKKQIQVNKQFMRNFEKREKFKNKKNNSEIIEPHAILLKEPLSSY